MAMTNDMQSAAFTSADVAVDLFSRSHNCAQSVLMAFADRFGLARETACRLANGFGVGLSCGETCGAVSGAVFVLGLAHGGGGPDAVEEKRMVYRLSREFMDRFREAHGSIRCVDLIGCNPSTPEGGAKAQEEHLFDFVCAGLVESATKLTEDMLGKYPPFGVRQP
jgi:C_GCAxxG_C_C family probable redox protein